MQWTKLQVLSTDVRKVQDDVLLSEKLINDITAGTIYPQIINRDNQVANPYSTMLKG